MNDPDRLAVAEARVAEAVMDRRIEALEKGIRRWRCLTAAGFLTALGAFGLAVFGLSQFENTYFIGEMASAQMSNTPQLIGVDPERGPAPDAGGATMLVLPAPKGLFDTKPGMASLPGKTSPSVLTGVQGELVAATDGGS